VLVVAAVHVFLTSAFSPVARWRPDAGGSPHIAAVVLFLYFVGLVSSAAALLEEWAELDTIAADVLRCTRDVALVAAGHACWPLAGLLSQGTVWRRQTAVSRVLSRASSRKMYRRGAIATGFSFVVSVACAIAWPSPAPWRIRPAPPLRTALIALPGPAVFMVVLLLTLVCGASPCGEAVSVLSATVCVLGAVVMVLVPWDEDQLPAAFDERALTNILLSAAVLSSWWAAHCWARQYHRRRRSSLNDSLLLPAEGAPTVSAGKTNAVSSALLLSACPRGSTATQLLQPSQAVGPVQTLLAAWTDIFGASSSSSSSPASPDGKASPTASLASDPAARRQELAITAM
jgi:hypothetical protein